MTRKLFRLVSPTVLAVAVVLLYVQQTRVAGFILVLASLGLSVVSLFLPSGKEPQRAPLPEDGDAKRREAAARLEEEKDALKKELEDARREADAWKEAITSVYNSYLAFEAVLPVVEKLSGLVTQKSERSTIDLTNNIFSIAEVSGDVSGKIHELLEEMTRGDKSLESNIHRLEGEMESLSVMEESFLDILTGYRTEIKALSSAITNIKEFTEALTDLSERTHILAINASVEAARVGSKGAGFAVIAGEVQKLAAHSKEIAGNIQDLTGRIDNQVHSSFRDQGEQIDEAVRGIQRSRDDMADMVKMFGPQAKMISQSIGESQRLSENVTENLNHITVSLQFQDYIRQVIEHVITILNDRAEECLHNFPAGKLERRKKTTILEEEMKKEVEKYFTIRDEWEILGLDFEEPRAEETRETSDTDEFGDNVSLF